MCFLYCMQTQERGGGQRLTTTHTIKFIQTKDHNSGLSFAGKSTSKKKKKKLTTAGNFNCTQPLFYFIPCIIL